MLDSSSPPWAHVAQGCFLVLLSLVFLPLDTFVLLFSRLLIRDPASVRARHGPGAPTVSKTILVTGVSMTKGLALARTLYLAGHVVIGADFEPDGVPVNGRYSRSLKKFFTVTVPTPANGSATYLHQLLTIVQQEKVDLWISCSSLESSTADGQAAQMIEAQSGCRAVQFGGGLTKTLHEKDSFMKYAADLGLATPETHRVDSRAAVHQVLQDAGEKRFILKSIDTDLTTRGDLTLLPRPTPSETYQHLSTLDISPSSPWILQRFIRGREYCSHAMIVQNDVRVFVACPSSEMVMHYAALAPDSVLSRAMQEYTQMLVSRSNESMNGHLSLDFLVEDERDKPTLYPIECNPRPHTAVVLMQTSPRAVSDAYLSVLEHGTSDTVRRADEYPTPVVVPTRPMPCYWIGHDLVSLVLVPLFQLLSRGTSMRAFIASIRVFISHLLTWREATFELWDPLPWWWMYHVYWPAKFLLAIRDGRRWNRVNLSTTRMFPC
ncbi:MAG: hypothetical protein M1838_004806 [Thelocarpon superellum]|nr:MAG: hypothetical protein M1838_004806 [Thelocarpon superellum]